MIQFTLADDEPIGIPADEVAYIRRAPGGAGTLLFLAVHRGLSPLQVREPFGWVFAALEQTRGGVTAGRPTNGAMGGYLAGGAAISPTGVAPDRRRLVG